LFTYFLSDKSKLESGEVYVAEHEPPMPEVPQPQVYEVTFPTVVDAKPVTACPAGQSPAVEAVIGEDCTPLVDPGVQAPALGEYTA
jgi:hypothetical protein